VNKTITSLTIALALGCGVAAAQQAMTEQDVRADLAQQGYNDVHDVDFHDGVWTARAKSGDGTKVKLRIDPTTGRAFPDSQISRLSEADVRAQLSTDGYTRVHDVDFNNGVWTAKAENQSGKDVKLQIDPDTGRIIGSN
jgi:uncharacterized membrane protein YkoI